MKPARIPFELPAKYLNPIYFLLVIVLWYLPLYGMLLLDLPDGLLLGLAITWVLLLQHVSRPESPAMAREQ